MNFPVSGVEVFPLVPPVISLCLSFFMAMGGVSGAFVLLPFQVSVLGFTSPAVSPTNMVYNIVAIPGGVYRYIREGRMAWPLAAIILIGTLPGIFIGALIRIRYLPDPAAFKFFVGWVLLYIGGHLVHGLVRRNPGRGQTAGGVEARFKAQAAAARSGKPGRIAAGLPEGTRVRTLSISLLRIEYEFFGERFAFNAVALLGLSAVVGVVGGVYGIGGGAILAPVLVAIFRLPVYSVAGATLLSTFAASIAGVIFYAVIAPAYADSGLAVAPDWLLGFLFGIGGLAGTYLGARGQKYMPERGIKVILVIAILAIAIQYILGFFLR